ncbi:MAG: glutaredoxin family protein [Candidatus Natronoplasma sp.]
MPKEEKLILFFGKECPECKNVMEKLGRLEEDENIKVSQYEVWHNSKNQSLMMKYTEERCIGVPFLFNKETGEYICGESNYERIKKWAKGKKLEEGRK